MADLVYFPSELLALQVELSYHPELQVLLVKHPSYHLEERLAEIATYCDVLVDGYYTEPELIKLADILRRKLLEKRISILLPS